jgi:HK97 family phage major capsid protein
MSTLTEARAVALKAAMDAQNAMNAAGDQVTYEMCKEVEKRVNEVKEIDERIAASKSARDMIASLAGNIPDDNTYEPGEDSGMKAATFGDRYVRSSTYSEWAKAHPSGLGEGSNLALPGVKIGDLEELLISRKANGQVLATPVAHTAPIRYPMVDMVDRRPLTLLDVIGHGQMAGNFEYVQVTAVSNNAAIVKENTQDTDPLKPTSDMTTVVADCKAYTFADGYEVTNQLLSDAPAFAAYMNTAVRYNLDTVIEDKVLNGTGTEEPKGILKTSGVQEKTYTAGADAMDLAKAVRGGRTKITNVGGVATGVILHPEDVEALDLMQDADKRFYGLGPWGIGPRTLWGAPVVESSKIVKGQALMGDFNQVQLLDREGLSVVAFNQHKDFAARNRVYVRAELRAGLVIWRPNRLCLVKAA